MTKICVLIRVYNRIEDLENCVKIIKDTWKLNEYYVLVVANGKEKGYHINEEIKNNIDCLVELEKNAGHIEGNKQLLLEGIPYIPNDCMFTIILEADTWIYSDKIIQKYIARMANENAVWASAKWFYARFSLATDFAIINTKFLLANTTVLNFNTYKNTLDPEDYVAIYLIDNGFKYIHITENMPVHMPTYIKRYPFAPRHRFYVFPKSKMITHHVETLKGGMEEKKRYFNILSQTEYFKINGYKSPWFMRFAIKSAINSSYIFPNRSWIKKMHKRKV